VVWQNMDKIHTPPQAVPPSQEGISYCQLLKIPSREAVAKCSLNNFFKVDEAPSPHKYKRRGRRFYIMALIEGFLQQSLKGGFDGRKGRQDCPPY